MRCSKKPPEILDAPRRAPAQSHPQALLQDIDGPSPMGLSPSYQTRKKKFKQIIWTALKVTLNMPKSNSEIFGTFVQHHCCFTLAFKPDICFIFVFVFAFLVVFVFAFVFLLYFQMHIALTGVSDLTINIC